MDWTYSGPNVVLLVNLHWIKLATAILPREYYQFNVPQNAHSLSTEERVNSWLPSHIYMPNPRWQHILSHIFYKRTHVMHEIRNKISSNHAFGLVLQFCHKEKSPIENWNTTVKLNTVAVDVVVIATLWQMENFWFSLNSSFSRSFTGSTFLQF